MYITALLKPIIATARALNKGGLTYGYSGNVSIRNPDGQGLFITPSAVPYGKLTVHDIPALKWNGDYTGEKAPSTEWRLHLAIAGDYPEVNAIVHCHSPHATALACAQKEIPAFHYMVGFFGGDSIRCTHYALPGSPRLSRLVVEALAGRKACLMGNHGQIAVGKDLSSALYLAGLVEELSRIYYFTFAIGGATPLSSAQMEATMPLFTTYGTQDTPAPQSV